MLREDENFRRIMGLLRVLFLRATLGSAVGLAPRWFPPTQQLIKQQVAGDAPTFAAATEIIDALDERASNDDILTTYLNVGPFGRQ